MHLANQPDKLDQQRENLTQSIAFTYSTVAPSLYWTSLRASIKAKGNNRYREWNWKGVTWLTLVFLLMWVLRLDALQEIKTAYLAAGFIAGVSVTALGHAFFGLMQRKRINSVLKQTQSLRGPFSVEFGPDGCRFNSPLVNTVLKWQAVEEILDLRTGTGLRSGLLVYPLPNKALPDGVSPEDFRSTLEAWRGVS